MLLEYRHDEDTVKSAQLKEQGSDSYEDVAM